MRNVTKTTQASCISSGLELGAPAFLREKLATRDMFMLGEYFQEEKAWVVDAESVFWVYVGVGVFNECKN